jgi:hypothetical protein
MSLIPVADLCKRCFKSWSDRAHNKLRDNANHKLDCYLEDCRSEVGQDLISESKYHSIKDFVEKLRLLCHDCEKYSPQMTDEIEREVLKPLREKVYPNREEEDLEFVRVATNGKVLSIQRDRR